MELKLTHVEAIFDAMAKALRDEDNWNEDGVNWNFIDYDVYAAVADDMTLTGEMYATIFDLHAEMFEEDYDGLKSYNAFHNKLVDEIYEEIA
jgi:hypothetical protein